MSLLGVFDRPENPTESMPRVAEYSQSNSVETHRQHFQQSRDQNYFSVKKDGSETDGDFSQNGSSIGDDRKNAANVLADELNKMTFNERESINEEIHGINVDRKYIEEAGVVEETPEILAQSFLDMATELEKLRLTDGGVGGSAFAFNRSQEIFGSTPEMGTYLNTKETRLMFLRYERFDCQKAAERLCRFADLMYELYGDVALERPARWTDFSEYEMELMNQGRCQFLPGRDRAGRRIYIHFFSESWSDIPFKIRLRIACYCCMSALYNDPFSQRRGIVVVMWMHGYQKPSVNDFIKRGGLQARGSSCMPLRYGAVHYCFPYTGSAWDKAILHLVSGLAGRIKQHVRIHTGSAMECIYVLESFGIPSKQNPLNIATGEIDKTNYKRWVGLCAAREENLKLHKQIVECPNHSDILFGRGQIVMNHPGNIMFRNFIQSKLEVYSNVRSKKESTQWTWGAVRTLKHEYGARFLKEEKFGEDITAWTEVSNEIARSKVRIAFRDARTRLTKSAEKGSTNNESTGVKTTDTQNNSSVTSSPPRLVQSSSLSKRKNGTITAPDDFFSLSSPSPSPQQQHDQYDMPALNLEDLSNHLGELNSNISDLNRNLNSIMNYDVADSSTSKFLGLDDSNNKRQRLCSHNFFDCA